MSNKTQKSSDEKIESAPKKTPVIALLLSAILVLVIASVAFTFLSDKRMSVNGQRIDVTVANSPAEREKGLSGRERLAANQGMLFEYSDMGQYCMWMKDMKFALDMVWIDANKKVVYIQENATPESYPDETFCSPQDAKYVLEVNAGSVQRWGIKTGDTIKF